MCKKRKKYLPETHPWLIEGWDKDKNGDLKPGDVTYGSGKRAWWTCKVCGHSWMAQIFNRTRIKPTGCPLCANNTLNEYNRLDIAFPRVLDEWDYIGNFPLLPSEVAKGTAKKVTWVCRRCLHLWIVSVNNRTSPNVLGGCPSCSNQVVTEYNNLLKIFPGIAREWDRNKNTILKSYEVLPGSDRKVWWKCAVCFYSWRASINDRTGKRKTGCPACAGQVPTNKYNLTVKWHPNLEKEWDYVKNKIPPKEVTPGSTRKVWWACKNDNCKYSWEAQINNRSRKKNPSGCPRCSGGPVSKVSQKWLDRLDISVREYYIKDLGFRVDGFDPETGTVYEFLGDYWHGNPERFDLNEVNKRSKETFKTLYVRTFKKFRVLNKAGYKITYIWEMDFKLGKKETVLTPDGNYLINSL